MKRVSEIMQELGFRPDARESVKAAFLKNLFKQAYNIDVVIPPQYQDEAPTEQLSFDLEKLDFKDAK